MLNTKDLAVLLSLLNEEKTFEATTSQFNKTFPKPNQFAVSLKRYHILNFVFIFQ